MANTAISSIATDSIVLEGKDRVKKVSGKLAGSYLPGNVVYATAVGTWTTVTKAVTQFGGWIEFKKRTSSTFGEVDIDATYTDGTAINVEIIVGPRDGTIKLASKTADHNANYYYGERLSPLSGGSLKLTASQGTTATVYAIVTEEGYTDNDTVTKVYMVC